MVTGQPPRSPTPRRRPGRPSGAEADNHNDATELCGMEATLKLEVDDVYEEADRDMLRLTVTLKTADRVFSGEYSLSLPMDD